MANIRIKDLANTASSTASDDFIAVDGATNGTRKLNAYSPSFGGNATVAGTLTVNNSFGVGAAPTSSWASGYYALEVGNTSTRRAALFANGDNNFWLVSNAYFDGSSFKRFAASSATGYEQVNGEHKWSYAASGSAGASISFTTGMTLNSSGNLQIAATTASTSTSTGALVVSGGVGVAGNINAGALTSSHSITGGDTGPGTSILQIKDGLGTVKVNFRGNGNIDLGSTTASTSTSTGALVVSGGVGVAGALYVGGVLSCTSSGVSQINGTLLVGTQAASGASLDVQTASGTASTLRLYQQGVSNWVWSVPASTDALVLSQYGTTEAMRFDSNRKATFAATIKTAAPSGGTAAEWKLGTVASVSPTSPNRTIEVDIGGTIYYIHAKTTNN